MATRTASERSNPARSYQAGRRLSLTSSCLQQVVLCTLISLPFVSAGKASSDPVPGRQVISASRLIDMIGVNTHMQYTDGSYSDLPRVLQLFKRLGIRRARDVMPAGLTRGIVRRMIYDGIKFNFFLPVGWEKGGTIGYLKSLEANVPGAVASVEGYNEINNSVLEFNNLSGPAAAFAGQQALYKAIKSDEVLKNKPVLDLSGFEMTEKSYPEKRTTLKGYADTMNLHVYAQNGNQPGNWIRSGVPDIYQFLKESPQKAITEFGYASLPQSGWLVIGVDERSQAKGVLNGIFDAAISGFDQVYLYELVDQRRDPASMDRELHFGLFRYDYQPKIAALAISNMIGILGEEREGGSETADSADDQVEIAADRGTDGIPVRSLKIRKADGSLLVAVWRETPFWDRAKGEPLEAPMLSSKISFRRSCGSLKLYDLLESRQPIWVRPSSSTAFDVKDHVQLIECTKT